MVSSVIQGSSKNRLQILPLKSVYYFLCSILVVLLILACVDRILLPDLARKAIVGSPAWVDHNKRVNNFMTERNLSSKEEPVWRSASYQVDKAAQGKKRVLVIGDSFVWGDGLENMNDTWWRQLQLELNRRGYQNVEVIGAGACGASTRKELEWAKKLNDEYNPDAIVFGYVANDPDEGSDIAGSGIVKQLTSAGTDQISQLLASFSTVFPNLAYQLSHIRDGKLMVRKSGPAAYEYEEWQEKILEGPNWAAYSQTVANLGDFAQKSKKPVFVISLPLPMENLGRLLKPVQNLFAQNSVPFLNCHDAVMAWSNERTRRTGEGVKTLVANPVNGHPSLPLNHYFASTAADYLEKNYGDALGPKTPASSSGTIEINDFIPPVTVCKKVNPSTFTLYYPLAEKDFLHLPLNRPYIQLNLSAPAGAKSIHIAGKNLAGASLAVRAGDPSKYADTAAIKDLGSKKGNECNFKLPDNTVIDEVLISADLDGPNNMILVQFNQ